jgi:hypothetical protein
MIPNLPIHEQLMFERGPQRQSAAAWLRLAAGIRREQDKLSHRLVVTLAGFVIKLGSSLQHLDPKEKQVTYDQ